MFHRQHSVRFSPMRELVSLRVDHSMQMLVLRPSGNDTSIAVGFEQMDIVATFTAPAGGWETLIDRPSPCSFGVRLHLGGQKKDSVGHAVWIQSHCNATVADTQGCAALQAISLRRMDQAFRNGAGAIPERAAELTLDRGYSSINATVPLDGLFGGTRLLGGPLVLPRGGGPLELRVVVDHSLIEAFAAGRASVTGFAPRLAMDYDPNATGVALENTCEGVGATARLWEMSSAELEIPH
eukprot:COSAG02_NODE_8554_length_2524_cov_97.366374_2_plen_239_part_00